MKNKSLAIAAIAASIALGASAVQATPAAAHGSDDKQNQMNGHMSGNMGGMMSGHMGQMMSAMMSRHGQMGGGHMGGGHMGGKAAKELNLDVDDVRKIVDGRLVWQGNDRLKVGKIEVVDEKTITAEIVTVDDSLVYKLQFNRKTGAHRPVRQ